jgi:hypothetical protein
METNGSGSRVGTLGDGSDFCCPFLDWSPASLVARSCKTKERSCQVVESQILPPHISLFILEDEAQRIRPPRLEKGHHGTVELYGATGVSICGCKHSARPLLP